MSTSQDITKHMFDNSIVTKYTGLSWYCKAMKEQDSSLTLSELKDLWKNVRDKDVWRNLAKSQNIRLTNELISAKLSPKVISKDVEKADEIKTVDLSHDLSHDLSQSEDILVPKYNAMSWFYKLMEETNFLTLSEIKDLWDNVEDKNVWGKLADEENIRLTNESNSTPQPSKVYSESMGIFVNVDSDLPHSEMNYSRENKFYYENMSRKNENSKRSAEDGIAKEMGNILSQLDSSTSARIVADDFLHLEIKEGMIKKVTKDASYETFPMPRLFNTPSHIRPQLSSCFLVSICDPSVKQMNITDDFLHLESKESKIAKLSETKFLNDKEANDLTLINVNKDNDFTTAKIKEGKIKKVTGDDADCGLNFATPLEVSTKLPLIKKIPKFFPLEDVEHLLEPSKLYPNNAGEITFRTDEKSPIHWIGEVGLYRCGDLYQCGDNWKSIKQLYGLDESMDTYVTFNFHLIIEEKDFTDKCIDDLVISGKAELVALDQVREILTTHCKEIDFYTVSLLIRKLTEGMNSGLVRL